MSGHFGQDADGEQLRVAELVLLAPVGPVETTATTTALHGKGRRLEDLAPGEEADREVIRAEVSARKHVSSDRN